MAEYYEITVRLHYKIQDPGANEDELNSLEEAIEIALDSIGSFPNPDIGPFEALDFKIDNAVKIDGD